jgi:hypothetical protein
MAVRMARQANRRAEPVLQVSATTVISHPQSWGEVEEVVTNPGQARPGREDHLEAIVRAFES